VLLSVTVTVNANGVEPAAVGVPLSVPSGLSVTPGGNVPAVTSAERQITARGGEREAIRGAVHTRGGVCPGLIKSGAGVLIAGGVGGPESLATGRTRRAPSIGVPRTRARPTTQ